MPDDTASFTPAPRLDAALAYIHRGWPIVPLHDVAMGFCSCGDTSAGHMETSAGKHPLAKRWQHAAVLDEEILRGLFGGRPDMNFGVKTGQASKIFVLDVDPKNGGDLRLNELQKEHGTLPDTYTVRTGSGGRHLFFELPESFTPTNSRGSLPVGLDIRGEGGFVVGAPCRSGIGDYEVLLPLPVVQASEWLLEMIRPRVPVDVEHLRAMEHYGKPELAAMGDRGQRYAYAAVMAELARLREAVPGERGSTAFRVACNLVELCNSPWAQLNVDQVRAGFADAALACERHGGAFRLAGEGWAAWGSAERKVGARGRAAPVIAGGVLLGWDQQHRVPPFQGSPGAGQGSLRIDGLAEVTAEYQDRTDVFQECQVDDRSVFSPGPGAVQGHIPMEFQVVPGDPQGANDLVDRTSRFISGSELAKIPPPSWLIDGWLVRDSIAQIIGKSNEGKSFVALDMALCVADGRPWRGRKVHKGRVGYVVAEGVAGMGQRYLAWCKQLKEGADVEDIFFLPMPVQVADAAAWDDLIADAVALRLDFLILDTQARITEGVEENSAKEMGLVVGQLERLRRVTKACVTLVHHLGKYGSEGRGSGVIRNAAASEITVSREKDTVTVTITKQKDAEFATPLNLRLVSVVTGHEPGWGGATITAGVLVDVDAGQAEEWRKLGGKAAVIRVLTEFFPHYGATKAEARSEAMKRGVASATFYASWDKLQKDGVIRQMIINDKVTHKYTVTPVDLRSVSPELSPGFIDQLDELDSVEVVAVQST